MIQRQAGAPSRRNTGKCTVDYRQGCCTIKSVELGAATWVTPYNNNNQGMHQGAPALGACLHHQLHLITDLKSTSVQSEPPPRRVVNPVQRVNEPQKCTRATTGGGALHPHCTQCHTAPTVHCTLAPLRPVPHCTLAPLHNLNRSQKATRSQGGTKLLLSYRHHSSALSTAHWHFVSFVSRPKSHNLRR